MSNKLCLWNRPLAAKVQILVPCIFFKSLKIICQLSANLWWLFCCELKQGVLLTLVPGPCLKPFGFWIEIDVFVVSIEYSDIFSWFSTFVTFQPRDQFVAKLIKKLKTDVAKETADKINKVNKVKDTKDEDSWEALASDEVSDWLTHWGRDKMAAIFLTTFSNAFSWMKMLEFLLRFHWSLFLRVQLTIFQHWFR